MISGQSVADRLDLIVTRKDHLAVRPTPSIGMRHHLMRAHLDDMLSHYGTAAMRLARKHIAWYAHGLPGAAELRDIANNNTDAAMVFAAVDEFFEALDPSDVAA